MCEVTALVILGGRRYRIPSHPEYEPARFGVIQECLVGMIEHLKSDFTGDGTIFITWEDDQEQPMTMNASKEIDLLAAIQSWNQFAPSLPCIVELLTIK
jgi:hypothetical protein